MPIHVEKRQLVAPGELVADGEYLAGDNCYRIGGNIYSSSVGLIGIDGTRVSVIPLKGSYMPKVGDIVLGRVTDIGPSGWNVDISAPYPSLLPASEVSGPRMGRSRARASLTTFSVGDLVAAQVLAFDRTRDPLLTVRGPGLGKVSGGTVIRISAARVPRLIGTKGSMIAMLKKETGCEITVGQNGIALVSGKSPEAESTALEAIYMIDREAHTTGLTDRIRDMISKSLSSSTGHSVVHAY